jgi:hypothetical protein
VQVLLSLHAAPSRTRSETQPAVGPVATQVSVVQALLSSQFGTGPATHAPARHVSVPLHGLASAQFVPSGASVGRHEALIGRLPMTGEELTFRLDEIDAFQVIG